jgi:hypothetical protein
MCFWMEKKRRDSYRLTFFWKILVWKVLRKLENQDVHPAQVTYIQKVYWFCPVLLSLLPVPLYFPFTSSHSVFYHLRPFFQKSDFYGAASFLLSFLIFLNVFMTKLCNTLTKNINSILPCSLNKVNTKSDQLIIFSRNDNFCYSSRRFRRFAPSSSVSTVSKPTCCSLFIS